MKLAAVVFFIGVATAAFVGCSATFGTKPSEADHQRFAASTNFDPESRTFHNQDRDAMERMNKRMGFWTLLKLQFQSVKDSTPEEELPVVNPDMKEFMSASDKAKAIWFGHSTLLFNVGGKTVLVDPVFSDHAAPFSFMIKRFQKPPLKIDELPEIDTILISHDHYDHLDIDSIKHFANKKTSFVVPLGVGGHLIGWGIDPSRITELDWWQKHDVGDLSFIATPAQHFSGRFIKRNNTLWSGWIIQNGSHRIFYSGDSGYGRHFKEIGEKYGPFDAAFIDIGQYNPLWEEVHMPPPHAVQAFTDLNAKQFVPVHWGAFVLAKHSWYEPIVQVSKLSAEKGIKLLNPRLGESFKLDGEFRGMDWWTSSRSKIRAQ